MTDAPPRPRQLAFDLPSVDRRGVEDFLVGESNEAAYALVESWPLWPDAWARIVGPEGSGKSHLGAIWAQRAHAWTVPAGEVTMERVPHLVSAGALLVEDCDRQHRDEPAFFHLMNAMKARGGHLLLTARMPPDQWGVGVPDLLSRLRLAPGAEIAPPDDALLKAVLVKLFIDRQLVLDIAVIDMLALRMERSFATAQALVDALDRLSLERGRRVTRALATEALATMEPLETDSG